MTYKTPALPVDEPGRLVALRSYDILDTLPEQEYDDITQLAAAIVGAPISLVSLIDEHRQWFKSKHGIGLAESPREISFCAHTLVDRQPLIVDDAALDPRFAGNPFVTEDPNIRFYAGFPLVGPDNHALGALCVIDSVPRTLTPQQTASLQALSRQVMSHIELRRNVSDLGRRNTQLAELADTDALTGVPNHRAYETRYAEEMLRASETGLPLTLLMVDVDRFKHFNDTYGHSAGDHVLKGVARLLKFSLRATDFLARYGGEEFVALLPATEEAAAHVVAERMRAAVEAGYPGGYQVTASFGFAVYPEDACSRDDLACKADKALYAAKAAGRNAVRCHSGTA